MSSAPIRRTLSLLAMLAVALLLPAAPAAAHITVSPEQAAPGASATYTITVPNELTDQATVAVGVTLPAGFDLEAGQAVPGWTTTVDKRPDGTARAVRWTGGRIPPGTFSIFALQGRNPTAATTLTWPLVQRYERQTVSWTGPPGSANPAATTAVAGQAPTASTTASTLAAPSPQPTPPTVPGAAVGPPQSADAGSADDLARSRAALALALAGTALALAVAALIIGRSARPAARSAVEPDEPAAEPTSDGRQR
jgi:uncharacterized repeat protein (TIGR01451 family)